MSRYSGRCDLYDHVFMIGCRGTDDSMSEIEKFNIFKQRTGGILHQSRTLVLEKWNVDYEIEYINNPAILRKENIKNRWYYFYYGKKFASLKALNKYGYCTDFKIHFDSIIDLVPYYPFIISVMACDDKGEYVCITNYSEVDYELMQPWRKIKYANDSVQNYYKDELRKELIRVAKQYY